MMSAPNQRRHRRSAGVFGASSICRSARGCGSPVEAYCAPSLIAWPEKARRGSEAAKGHSMWSTRCEELDTDRSSRFTIELDSRPATFAEVLRGWVEDEGFRAMFGSLLASSRFSAFRWEVPPITTATVRRHFE